MIDFVKNIIALFVAAFNGAAEFQGVIGLFTISLVVGGLMNLLRKLIGARRTKNNE